MKTLEDLVRNSAKEWVDKSTPTMVNTAEKVVQRIRLQRLIKFGSAGIAGLSVVAIMIWAGSNSTGTTAVQSVPVFTEHVVAPVSTVQVAENIVLAAPAPNVTRARVAPRQRADQKFEQPASANELTAFSVKSDVQSFKVEYDRILTRAQSFATSDPLMGASEYQGLARFCKKHSQHDLSKSALRSARVLAEQTGDEGLKLSIDKQLGEFD